MNDQINPDAPKFDLFATEVEDNLKEELAKGTFQWTNRATRFLAIAFVIVGLLSVGTWYGHYEATKTPTITGASSFASLRAAFGGGGGFGAAGGTGAGATGTGASAGGGFGGFGGTRITGTIKSVQGSTVTITLNDPTQSSSLTTGDTARVTDTGVAAAGALAGGQSSASGTNSSTTSAPSPAASPAVSGGTGRRGGAFSNPALTACLKKAGITFTAGTRPNFQDPATAQAIQSCFTQLGITPGGGFGGGAAGGAIPAPASTK
jgi:hypothetical protein